jgi:hypothetical protein
MTETREIHHGDVPPAGTGAPSGRRAARVRWLARVGLLAWLVLLCVRGIRPSDFQWLAAVPEYPPEDLLQPLNWVAAAALVGLLLVLEFTVLGGLAALSWAPLAPAANRRRWIARRLAVVLAAVGVSLLVALVRLRGWPGVASLVLPTAGFTLGAWIGFSVRQGLRSAVWLLPKLALVALVLGALSAGLAHLAMDAAPLPFEPPKVTSADKRRLADLIRHSRQPDGSRRLRVTEQDANLLLAILAPHGVREGKAVVAFGDGAIAADLSFLAPRSLAGRRYVNVETRFNLAIREGRLSLGFDRLQVGRLAVPRLLLWSASPAVRATLVGDPDVGAVLAAVDSFAVRPGAVEAVVHRDRLDRDVLSSLLSRVIHEPQVVESVRVQLRHLVDRAPELPKDSDRRFLAFVQTAFELAESRSQAGDAARENRAAILALAILLGHPRVEDLVGPVTDRELRQAARRGVGRATLRGRNDWVRHFCVSGALALLSNEGLSDEAGLTKEELDAGEGGSGFSFADLLADRAGTQFALAATRDEGAARRMQARLSAPFSVDAIFPPAADLPEGLPDALFQRRYGGVGGEGYRRMIAEIDRRLATADALQP